MGRVDISGLASEPKIMPQCKLAGLMVDIERGGSFLVRLDLRYMLGGRQGECPDKEADIVREVWENFKID